MSELETAKLFRLRKTSVGHKVQNLLHASVFRFTNLFIDLHLVFVLLYPGGGGLSYEVDGDVVGNFEFNP